MAPRGPDVSQFQGNVDWHQVAAAGASFGIARAGLGVGDPDPTFAQNWIGIKAAGLVRGAYHYAYPLLGNQPDAEADDFLSRVTDIEAGDFLVLDIEDVTNPPRANPDLNAWCVEWLRHVEVTVGFRPWLYTGAWYALGRLSDAALADFPLWNSDYSVINPPMPYGPWSHISMWQHTNKASYPGITGLCDESLFFGTVDDLRALGKGGSGMQKSAFPPDGYIVRSGDTMSSIAAAKGISLQVLEQANPQISDPNVIQVGDVLHIPGATPPGPHPGHLIAATALKVQPNHTSAAMAQAPAGGQIMVLPWQATTQHELWQRVRWTDKEGWVLASNVSTAALAPAN